MPASQMIIEIERDLNIKREFTTRAAYVLDELVGANLRHRIALVPLVGFMSTDKNRLATPA